MTIILMELKAMVAPGNFFRVFIAYLNITTSIKKKDYMKFYTILLQVFEYNNITKIKKYMKFYKILL